MKSEALLRKFRQKVFDYPEEKAEQVKRVIEYMKKRVIRQRGAQSVGLYSGLTASELRKSGTCETDWF